MIKKSICFFLILYSSLAFILPVSAKENFWIREKDIEKKLIELWNGDDPEAFEEFYSEEFTEIGGFSHHLFSP